jgi:hypothetical protein
VWPRANGFAQRTVRLDQRGSALLGEPPFEPVHPRLALRLVVGEARLGAQRLLACLLVVIAALAQPLAHHLACVRHPLCAVAELAPAMRQAVTPEHRRVMGQRIARQRVRHRARVGQPRRPLGQEALAVVARMTAAGVIQTGGGLAPLHAQRRGGHPRAVLGRGQPVGLRRSAQRVVFLHQRQDAYRRGLVQDPCALSRLVFPLRTYLGGAVPEHRALGPLCRRGDRPPKHGLIGGAPRQGPAQQIAPHRPDGTGLGAVLRCTRARGKSRRNNLAARRAALLPRSVWR